MGMTFWGSTMQHLVGYQDHQLSSISSSPPPVPATFAEAASISALDGLPFSVVPCTLR
eukprot:NODE_2621_length_337_cov_59.785714_g2611_i0.p1 GENE.NODE_2621_length_337_cov_59.785714_g2611_i0~~NODE_2621_length_337_cov_59.785714_g2611_i0.p1  ORF type:complete len:58 (+),score=13.34 NODE_2621_length_337_cov_59.785714_g2611_i0:160-333(+)